MNLGYVIGGLVTFIVMGTIGTYVCSMLITTMNITSTDPMYASQMSLIQTFELGITMCRLIVIISIIVIAWLLLQQAGIVPRMAPGVQWYGGGGGMQ